MPHYTDYYRLTLKLWSHSSSGLCWTCYLAFPYKLKDEFLTVYKRNCGVLYKAKWTKHLMPNKKDRNSNLQNPQKAGYRNKCLSSQSTYDEMGGDKRSLRGLQATWPGLHICTQGILSQKNVQVEDQNWSYLLTFMNMLWIICPHSHSKIYTYLVTIYLTQPYFCLRNSAEILPKIFNLQKTLGRTDICTIWNQMTKKNLPIYLSLIWFFCIRVLLFKYYWSCMWLVRFKHVSFSLQVNVEGMASLNSNLSCSVLESRKYWLFHSNFSVFKIMNILSFGEDLLKMALKAWLTT